MSTDIQNMSEYIVGMFYFLNSPTGTKSERAETAHNILQLYHNAREDDCVGMREYVQAFQWAASMVGASSKELENFFQYKLASDCRSLFRSKVSDWIGVIMEVHYASREEVWQHFEIEYINQLHQSVFLFFTALTTDIEEFQNLYQLEPFAAMVLTPVVCNKLAFRLLEEKAVTPELMYGVMDKLSSSFN